MSVSIDPGRLNPATPVQVFRAPFIAHNEVAMSYDVLPDDRAFVVISRVGGIERATST